MFYYVYLLMTIAALACMIIVSVEKDREEEKNKTDKKCPWQIQPNQLYYLHHPDNGVQHEQTSIQKASRKESIRKIHNHTAFGLLKR